MRSPECMVTTAQLLSDVESQIQSLLQTGVEETSAGSERARMIRLSELQQMRRDLKEELHAESGGTVRLVQPVDV